jgi:hypothetical protein
MEFKKTLLYASGLALATGGPISLFSASDAISGVKRSWTSPPAAVAKTSEPPATVAPLPTPTAPASSYNVAYAAPAPNGTLDPLPTPHLADVLRFDITVEWVMQRWPRVSTGLPYLQLQGYRVPLVTGTSLTDVAGSLTYYFNAQQHVQRITFRGTTGDPSMLAAFLAERHQFARRLTNDPGIVLYEAVDSGDKPAGTLKIRSARVVKANQPYTRFDVELEMDRVD